MQTLDINDEWELFLSGKTNTSDIMDKEQNIREPPKCSNIYISTKTKIAYLNQTIHLYDVFWNINVMPYDTPYEGVVKKQMKFNSTTKSQVDEIIEKTNREQVTCTKIITQINNPTGRISFKDVRKISVGLCKKDILNNRSKEKSAFYNCFVVILRIKIENTFKEIHIKVFNTGKLEIPGIQTNEMFEKAIQLLIQIIQPYIANKIEFIENKSETVLVNSNFTCNYYLDREKFHNILKYKYRINSNYDPCSYPGIQCKYPLDDGGKISFMIFRTGSVLIVGKCEDDILFKVYEYLSDIFKKEFINISCDSIPSQKKQSSKKKRKLTIYI
tara:strand:- start:5682 stop:6668 length:987 start_codon:yes stop_codon:yes gene_type:complete